MNDISQKHIITSSKKTCYVATTFTRQHTYELKQVYNNFCDQYSVKQHVENRLQ